MLDIINNYTPEKSPIDYLDDITSSGKLMVRPELVEESFPIPLDYFQQNHKYIYLSFDRDEILSLNIATEYHLTSEDISVNPDNCQQCRTYLISGKPLELIPHSISSGIIAATEEYLVLVGSPNRDGIPGRLFLIWSKEIQQSYTVSSCLPIDYQSTMENICSYNQSLVDQIIVSINQFITFLTNIL